VLLASEDMIAQRIDTHLAGAKRMTVSVDKHLGDGRSGTPAEKSLPNVQRETSLKLIRGKVQQKPKRVPVEGHLLSLIRRHDRLRGFGLRGRKKLCENRRIRVSGPRRKTLRALQLQHLNQQFQTDVRECPLVLGPATHDVRRKGAL